MSSQPQTRTQERTISANGVEVVVAEYPLPGRPALVLLHGIGSRGESWWPVADALAEQFHLYQVDLRGHGASAKPESGYQMATLVADLDAVLDALGLDRPLVMGHSLGALITLLWASEHPGKAAAIVLEDPPLRILPEILEAFDGWQQLAALTPEQAAAWYQQEYPDWSLEDCLRRAETITSTAPGVFADLRAESADALANGTTDRLPSLATISSPALLLRGNLEMGGLTLPDDADRFLEIVPSSTAVYIAEAGHGLHRDAIDPFLAAVLPFLQQH